MVYICWPNNSLEDITGNGSNIIRYYRYWGNGHNNMFGDAVWLLLSHNADKFKILVLKYEKDTPISVMDRYYFNLSSENAYMYELSPKYIYVYTDDNSNSFIKQIINTDTHKIKSVEELFGVHSLGFQGTNILYCYNNNNEIEWWVEGENDVIEKIDNAFEKYM